MTTGKYKESDLEKVRREEREKRQSRELETQKPFHFADRLAEQIKAKKSTVCVGLDPRLEQIPTFIRQKHFKKYDNKLTAAAEAIIEFNKGIIDAVHDLVPIVKPQIAFYELFGSEGVRAFEETLWYARDKGVMTLADIKRGDIGSTAEAYAKAYLGKLKLFGEEVFGFDVDAVTVTPYLGWDGIKPFIEEARINGKGVFILAKTSNPSSGDFQDLEIKDTGNTVYELMAHYVDSWGADDLGECGYSFVGAVVGATYPGQAKKLRALMPSSFFLVPGYGAQGGTAKDVRCCFGADGFGAIVNSSRGIIYAWENSDVFTEKDYAEAARKATKEMIKDLS